MRIWLLLAASVAVLPTLPMAQEAAVDSDAAAEVAAADTPAAPPAADTPGEPPAADLFSDDELDDLAAPVALYPDSLLTQVLVAATYPLDVVKADRFLADHADATDSERADLVNAEDWDESVRVLAVGFPDVLGRMSDDIDWTQDLGDAMLAQTDDLLDAVQRMRAQAQAVGNLDSNEAQTVEVEGDTISIAPASPEVVYVPSYDPATAYTTPATAPPVVYQDPGMTMTDVLTTGAIAFGSAMLVDAIFDDDDDDWDDDYWGGHHSIDWDDDSVYPRGINGDVNVNVHDNNVRIGDRDGDYQRQDAWKPSNKQKNDARSRIDDRRTDLVDQRSDNRNTRDANRDEIRDGNRDARQANQADNRDARDAINDDNREARDAVRDGNREDRQDNRSEASEGRPDAGAQRTDGGDDRRTQAEAKLKARSSGDGGPAAVRRGDEASPAKRQGPSGKDATGNRASGSTLKPEKSGSHAASKAKDRASTSLQGRDGASPKAPSKPKAISRPKQTASAKPTRKPAPKTSALKKPKVSASRSSAAHSRGSRSGGAQKKRR